MDKTSYCSNKLFVSKKEGRTYVKTSKTINFGQKRKTKKKQQKTYFELILLITSLISSLKTYFYNFTYKFDNLVISAQVQNDAKVWILRPFPQHRFARPARRGPDLLLKQLRGEKIDWSEVAEAFNKSKQKDNKIVTPHLLCAQCARLSPCENFTLQQLRQEAARKCIACTGATRCPTCETIMDRQVCQQCAGLRECRQCCQWCLPGDFGGQKPQCKTCQTTSRASVCGRCTLWKPLMKFRRCAGETPSNMRQRARRRCDACWEEEVESKRRSHVAVAAGPKRGLEGTLPSAKRARASRE